MKAATLIREWMNNNSESWFDLVDEDICIDIYSQFHFELCKEVAPRGLLNLESSI